MSSHIIVLLLLVSVSFKVTPSVSEVITVAKCCAANDSYVVRFDSCETGNNDSSINFQFSYPPVYSSDGETIVENPKISLSNHSRLSKCRKGFVHSVSTDFLLFENGTLSVSTLGISRPPSRFCIDEFETLDPFEPMKLIVRFCVPDPCLEANCIRKCCPQGMRLLHVDNIYEDAVTCAPRKTETDIPFEDFVLQNLIENSSSTTNSYIFRSGIWPDCPEDSLGLQFLRPVVYEIERFVIIQNGSLFVQGHPPGTQMTDNYCIDYKTGQDNLTYFVGAECMYPTEKPEPWFLQIFPYVFFTSSAFLIATFVIYALLPDMHNVHGLSVMCQVAALAVTYICFAINQMKIADMGTGAFCIGFAAALHFFSLSAFTWLNIISFQTWWIFRDLMPTIGRELNNKRPFIYYSIYGWGLPLIVVLIGLILDSTYARNYDIFGRRLSSEDGIIRPDFAVNHCWFGNGEAKLVYLYGPIGFLILVNIVLFVLTTIDFSRSSNDTVTVRKHQAKQRFRVIFSLFILKGISWLTEIISYLVKGDVESWIAIDIFNILTGVSFFVVFICKPTVWHRLKKRFPCLERLDKSLNCCRKPCATRIAENQNRRRRDQIIAKEIGSDNSSYNHCSSPTSITSQETSFSSTPVSKTSTDSANHFVFNHVES